jgi:hypothetical protein
VTEAPESLMEEDAAADRPFTAALAISKARGGLPAPGFFDCARRLGRFAGDPHGQDARTFHAAELNAVFARGGVSDNQQRGHHVQSRVEPPGECLQLRRRAARFLLWRYRMGNVIRLAARLGNLGDTQAEFDLVSQETVTRYQAAQIDEDFLGPGHTTIPAFGSPATGYPWVKKTVQTAGTAAVVIVANAATGVVQLALDATSEKQEATLYTNDQRNWDGTKSLQFETRLALSVIPTGLVEAVWGLRSAWVDGPDNASQYIDFQVTGNGAVNVRIKDGVNAPQSLPTGVTLAAGIFHNFRFDATDPTNVLFGIDGPLALPNFALSFLATGGARLHPTPAHLELRPPPRRRQQRIRVRARFTVRLDSTEIEYKAAPAGRAG